MSDEKFMLSALHEAAKAAVRDEVPVGAVIVDSATGKTLAKAYNQSEHGNDPSAHAEIIAIRKACKKLKSKRLWNCDMYVTLEPCTMCAAAISFARIRRLVFGAADAKGGAVINGIKFYEQHTCHHKPEVCAGTLAEESSLMLKSFFAAKRSDKKQGGN